MTCIKTGGQLYIVPYNQYAWCDIHEVNGVLVARIVGTAFAPINGCEVIHGTVMNADVWFDKGNDVSTLITTAWINHGYDGSKIDG